MTRTEVEHRLTELADPGLPASFSTDVMARVRLAADDVSRVENVAAPAPQADRIRWSAVATGMLLSLGVVGYQVATGELSFDVISPMLGGWRERFTDLPAIGPTLGMAMGITLFVGGLLTDRRTSA